MHLGLTYDLQTDPTDWRQAEFDPQATIETVARALADLGHEVSRLGGADDLIAHRGALRGVELVLNLAEGRHGRCREAWVPVLLELWDMPCIGSGSLTQTLALDKVATKRLAASAGLATPRWMTVRAAEELPADLPLRFPLIVKPRYGGSGLGIDRGALVHDTRALRARVAWACQRFEQPCLIEEFVAFAELTVLLIGNHPPEALPIIQRPLDPVSRLAWHVAGPGCAETPVSPLELTTELEAKAHTDAVAIFELLGCRDMARVDLRLDAQGGIWFLEINPLPSFDPEGTMGLLAECMGSSYTALVGRIVDSACLRLNNGDASIFALRRAQNN